MSPRLSDSNVELYFEGVTRRELSSLGVGEALRSLFALIPAGGYLALISFLPHSDELRERILLLCGKVQELLNVPVLLSFGSRFVHRLGHTLLSGPVTGVTLLFTVDRTFDIPVPGAHYTFGRLHNAFATAAFAAVVQRQRHILRVHFRRNATETFDAFAATLLSAARKGSACSLA